MPSNFNKFKYAFLGTVLLIVTGLAAYQFLYAVPQKKCEAAGDWWSFRYRECAHPLLIVDMPGMRHRLAAQAQAKAGAAATPGAAAAASAGTSVSAAGHP